jgi:hypothetical protein
LDGHIVFVGTYGEAEIVPDNEKAKGALPNQKCCECRKGARGLTAMFRQSVEIRGKVGPNFEIILLVKSSLKLNLNMILANEIILKLGPTFSRISTDCLTPSVPKISICM